MSTSRFSQPPGFIWSHFNDVASGARIRYGYALPPQEPRLTLVMAGGFGEPAEKYFEVMNERLTRGDAVWFMDWRGQGGSDRYLPADPMKSHHAGYNGCIATLHQFARQIVPEDRPRILMAHSMGAHTGLRHVAEHPGVFSGAIFTDPMLRFSTGRVPQLTARFLASAGKAAGWFERYVPGGGPWMPDGDAFEGNQKTSDPIRFRIQPDLYLKYPHLQMGAPTFGWVWHSFRSCDILNAKDYLKSIKTPVLMQVSGDNAIVRRDAILRAAALMPQCKQVDIPGAKHEIWMERDELRGRMASATDAFLEQFAPMKKG
jgi:lysophospholipase